VLRNYLGQQVIDRAEQGDFEMFDQLIGALKKLYKNIKVYQKFSAPLNNVGKNLEISCSS
jgi:uncharacterized protein YdiU (UPF0061 family)